MIIYVSITILNATYGFFLTLYIQELVTANLTTSEIDLEAQSGHFPLRDAQLVSCYVISQPRIPGTQFVQQEQSAQATCCRQRERERERERRGSDLLKKRKELCCLTHRD